MSDEDYVIAGPAEEGIERYAFTGSLQAIREYLSSPHVRPLEPGRRIYRLVEIGAFPIQCPRCRLFDPSAGEWTSVFRAGQPARNAKVTVMCPKCQHRFEVGLEL